MNTYINLTYKGVPYKLEYDRATVKLLEANGFNIDEFLEKPATNIELAFSGAFIKNHRKVAQTTIDEILEHCPDKSKLIVQLRNMISETYEALLAEPNKDDEGNASWEVVDLSPKKSQK